MMACTSEASAPTKLPACRLPRTKRSLPVNWPAPLTAWFNMLPAANVRCPACNVPPSDREPNMPELELP